MAWVRSEQSLLRHPKTLHLKELLEVDLATTIGRLHMFWWWCLDYAWDGDLSKKGSRCIETACEVSITHLIRSGFVDSNPYRRVHGWYEIQGNYLRSRFKDSPEKWKRIKELYENDLPISLPRGNGEGNPSRKGVRSTADVRTDVRTNVRTSGEEEKSAAAAFGPSAPALPALPKIKSYEEAEENELCGPPPGWADRIKKGR